MKIIKNRIPKPETDMVAIDIEMFGQTKGRLHRPEGEFASIQICVNSSKVYVIDTVDKLEAALAAIDECTWVLHNALYDLRQLRRFCTIEPRFIWDTMLVEQAMKGGYYQNFSLKDLTRRYLGEEMEKEAREEFETATELTDDMIKYGARDALNTFKIAHLQRAEFEDIPAFNAYLKIDEPMIFPLLDVVPIKVDANRWSKEVAGFAQIAKGIEDDLDVNVFSPQQVIKAAKRHGLHLQNTQKETLKEYNEYPFIQGVIKGRMYRKAVSTYGEGWLEKNVEEGDRVYPELKITGAETGRMSSANPNIMQIPARKLPIYREFFIADEDEVIIVTDISQQEPRIIGYESKDKRLLEAIHAGEDLHLSVTRAAYQDDSLTKRNKKKRDTGKMINLGMGYGLTPQGLAKKTDLTEAQATELVNGYFKRFSGVRAWIGRQRAFAQRNGFIKTASGRRVYINPHSHQWKNNAINAPIQGGAADFTKMWIRQYWEECRIKRIPFFLAFPVHDELVLVAKKKWLQKSLIALEVAFNNTAEELYPGIPFVADTGYGDSWAEKK